ncbi:unnamed protein product [Rotaria magnacalcarata]|uniref:DUF2383 domain-containing protein n=1 Tax=Rotaria magnacalcarata TaxID=392030 RepID=A0A816Q2B9_9BILA|nr:unnamed protein product [Rotaria magnacalcarata]CAF2056201.1 unnamed protein product [Rotaria magnacalcarata]CAF3761168.1 unnamed protein product [Rotaria magnacalcarata]CAF3807528.1 unnamed protein product [Rotaria magnacalcarata]
MSSSNPAESSALADTTDESKQNGAKFQTVLEHLYNSYNSYKSCAEDCTDPVLQGVFQTISKIRSDFIGQLSSVIRNELGLEPVTSSSGLGKAHKTWINVKAWFTDGRSKALAVAEVHRGETTLIDQYETVLSECKILDEAIRQVLQKQLKIIREQDATICLL